MIDVNKAQGLWILSEQIASQESVKKAYDLAVQPGSGDLASVLEAMQVLTPELAAHVRTVVQSPSQDTEYVIPVKSYQSSLDSVDAMRAPFNAHPGAQVTALELLKAGDQFHDYQLRAEISRGAMGVILEAYDTGSDRIVALKFMLTDNPDETEVQRFIREAQTLIRLKHKHIVEIYDFGSEQGQCYFAMELVAGQDLHVIIEEQLRAEGVGLPVEEALDYLTATAQALHYCHTQGVVHRDFKPQNVIVEYPEGQPPRPVLVDFGLMKKLRKLGERAPQGQTIEQSLTRDGEIVGTPAFMAPEQFDPGGPRGDIGAHSDAWAWGATLFFLLTGVPPYNKASLIDIYQSILYEKRPRLSAVREDVPTWLEDLYTQCLQLEAKDRPSFEAILQALKVGREKSRVGKSKVWMIGVGAFIVVSLLLFIFLPRSPIALTVPVQWPVESNKSRVTLTGRVDKAYGALRIGTNEIQCDDQGRFKCSVNLKEGRNIVLLEAQHGSEWVELDRQEMFCDTIAPTVRVNDEEAINNFIFVDGNRRLQLIIEDQSAPFRLEYDNRALENLQRKAELTSFTHEGLELEVKVTDRLGNSREQTLKVISNNGIERFRAHLSDLEKWKNSTELFQDGAFAWIDRELGSSYRFIKAQEFRCADQAFRIGSYLHGATGIEFHLIPGQEVRTKVWARPLDAYAHCLLSIMSRPTATMGVLADGMTDLAMPLYGRLMREIFDLKNGVGEDEALARIKKYKFRIPRLKQDMSVWIQYLEQNKLIGTESQTVQPLLVGRFEASCKEWNTFALGTNQVSRKNLNWPLTNKSVLNIERWLKLVGDGFRLPSPAEWVYACRAGSVTTYFWGEEDKLSEEYCSIWESTKDGELESTIKHADKSNAFGLSDTLGNASEWSQVNWDRWVESVREAIKSNKLSSQFSDHLKQLYGRRNNAVQMGSQAGWWGGWATSDFFYYRGKDSPASQGGFRVFVTAPISKDP
jgi:serine/threonine protein kinase